MHQLLATLFSLLVALCHHTSFTARPVQAAELSPALQTSSEFANPSVILPDRYQLARSSTVEASYAETACVSCRRMDGSTSDR